MPPLRSVKRPVSLRWWVDIAPSLRKRHGLSLSVKNANLWTLVLEARRVPNMLIRHDDGLFLFVPPLYEKIAMQEIRWFVDENQRLHAPDIPPLRENTQITMWVLFGLMILHGIRMQWWFSLPVTPVELLMQGGVDALRIKAFGEWYRYITALTLHADSQHLFANVLFGGVFLVPLNRRLGSGLGWLLVLLTGVAGNWLNVYLHGYDHLSIGASTAMFSGVGLLSGIGVRYKGADRLREVFVPLAAGAAILAMLGAGGGGGVTGVTGGAPAGGSQVDLGAHAAGFVVGMLTGLAVGFPLRLGIPSIRVQRALGCLAAGIVAGAWMLAFA